MYEGEGIDITARYINATATVTEALSVFEFFLTSDFLQCAKEAPRVT